MTNKTKNDYGLNIILERRISTAVKNFSGRPSKEGQSEGADAGWNLYCNRWVSKGRKFCYHNFLILSNQNVYFWFCALISAGPSVCITIWMYVHFCVFESMSIYLCVCVCVSIHLGASARMFVCSYTKWPIALCLSHTPLHHSSLSLQLQNPSLSRN